MNEFNVKLHPFEVSSTINTLEHNVPYGVSMINAQEFWNAGYTGKGINIAIIDTGCDVTHPNLKDRIIGGRNFTGDDNGNPDIFTDYQGHGTHVAGTIGASNLGQGVVGVAHESNLLILKALDKTGRGNMKWIIDAIDYAISQKVDILSMSLGASTDSPQLYEAIKRAIDNDILVVCAAGNEGDNANPLTDELAYPGGYNEVISVGAVDQNKSAATFTNSNKEVDVVAPGVNILSTYPGGGYATLSGTSMATPHISGVLALLVQYSRDEFKRNLSEMEIYGRLIKNTITLNMARTLQGNGLVYLNIDIVPK